MFRMFIYVGFCFFIAVPWLVGARTISNYIFGDTTVVRREYDPNRRIRNSN